MTQESLEFCFENTASKRPTSSKNWITSVKMVQRPTPHSMCGQKMLSAGHTKKPRDYIIFIWNPNTYFLAFYAINTVQHAKYSLISESTSNNFDPRFLTAFLSAQWMR